MIDILLRKVITLWLTRKPPMVRTVKVEGVKYNVVITREWEDD